MSIPTTHSTGYRRFRNRRFRRYIRSNQLALQFSKVSSRRLPIYSEDQCPGCGAEGFVNACHYRCPFCGFAPACSD